MFSPAVVATAKAFIEMEVLQTTWEVELPHEPSH
jgi:hypothetical protein